jgi:hypothetical protein
MRACTLLWVKRTLINRFFRCGCCSCGCCSCDCCCCCCSRCSRCCCCSASRRRDGADGATATAAAAVPDLVRAREGDGVAVVPLGGLGEEETGRNQPGVRVCDWKDAKRIKNFCFSMSLVSNLTLDARDCDCCCCCCDGDAAFLGFLAGLETADDDEEEEYTASAAT